MNTTTLERPSLSKRVTDADRLIAQRLYELRISKGMTQQELADVLDVTYQQAHKYERAINRISAGKLTVIAQRLNIPLDYFFNGLANTDGEKTASDAADFKAARHLRRIRNVEVKRALASLIETIAAESL